MTHQAHENWDDIEHVAGNGLARWSPKVYQTYPKPGHGEWGVQGFNLRWFVVHQIPKEKAHGPFREFDGAIAKAHELNRGNS